MTAKLWLCHAMAKFAGKTSLHGVPIESVSRGEKSIIGIETHWMRMSGAATNDHGKRKGCFTTRLGRRKLSNVYLWYGVRSQCEEEII